MWSYVKFTVEWIDFKGSYLKGCFWWLMLSQERFLFQPLLCFFCGRHQVLHVVFTQLPILNEVSPCFLSTMQPSQFLRKSFPRSSFAGVCPRWRACTNPFPEKKYLGQVDFSPPWPGHESVCLLFPQAWIQWKIGKPPFGKLT